MGCIQKSVFLYSPARFLSIILVCFWFYGTVSSQTTSYIIAYTRDELRAKGWTISGTNPTVFDKPSQFKAALAALDDLVQGGSVWRVTSTNPTRFRFRGFTGDAKYCNVKSARIHMKYFSEMASVGISPCQGTYCYADPPANIVWERKSYTLDHERLLQTEIELYIHIPPGPGGYILFDQITIEHNGVDCSLTTTTIAPPTTEDSTTETDGESTTTTYETTNSDFPDTPISEGTPFPTTVTGDDETTLIPTTSEDPVSTTEEVGIPEDPVTQTPEPSTDIPTTTDEDPTESSSTTDTPSTADLTNTPTTTDVTDTPTTTDVTDTPTTTDVTDTPTTTYVTDTPTTTDVTDTPKTTDVTDTPTTTDATDTPTTTESIDPSSTTETTDGGSTTPEVTTLPTTFDTPDPTSVLPPISSPETSSTESSSETTILTSTDTSTSTTSYPTPYRPSTTTTTRNPITVIPPPIVLPGDEDKGLTLPKILLYIVLPTSIGILAFLATVFYFGFLGHKCCGWGNGGSKEHLLRESAERASGRSFTNNTINPLSQLQPHHIPNPIQSYVPVPKTGNDNVLLYPSSSYHQPQGSAFLNSPHSVPRNQPTSQFQPPPANFMLPPPPVPKAGKSVTLNIPSQQELDGGSRPSSRASSISRYQTPVMYTGDYTGGDLPRIRRKLD